jgi:hypothetical protein
MFPTQRDTSALHLVTDLLSNRPTQRSEADVGGASGYEVVRQTIEEDTRASVRSHQPDQQGMEKLAWTLTLESIGRCLCRSTR